MVVARREAARGGEIKARSRRGQATVAREGEGRSRFGAQTMDILFCAVSAHHAQDTCRLFLAIQNPSRQNTSQHDT